MAEVKLPVPDTREESSIDQGERKRSAPKMDRIVHERRETLGDKLRNNFASDVREVAEDFIVDEVVPGILESILDFFSSWWFGDRGRRRRDRDRGHDYRRDYDEPSYHRDRDDRRRRNRDRDEDRSRRSRRVDYRSIVIEPDRGESMGDAKYEAERLVKALRNRIDKYGQATVADLLEGAGYDSSWVDTDRGWVDENDIGLQRVRGGYLIDVAEATDLR